MPHPKKTKLTAYDDGLVRARITGYGPEAEVVDGSLFLQVKDDKGTVTDFAVVAAGAWTHAKTEEVDR